VFLESNFKPERHAVASQLEKPSYATPISRQPTETFCLKLTLQLEDGEAATTSGYINHGKAESGRKLTRYQYCTILDKAANAIYIIAV
jgi:hypothetical protein